MKLKLYLILSLISFGLNANVFAKPHPNSPVIEKKCRDIAPDPSLFKIIEQATRRKCIGIKLLPVV